MSREVEENKEMQYKPRDPECSPSARPQILFVQISPCRCNIKQETQNGPSEDFEGARLGDADGTVDGQNDGTPLGLDDGLLLGSDDGAPLGLLLGLDDGTFSQSPSLIVMVAVSGVAVVMSIESTAIVLRGR